MSLYTCERCGAAILVARLARDAPFKVGGNCPECGWKFWKTKKQRENEFRKLDDVLETLENLNLLSAKGRKFRTHIWRKYWDEPYSKIGEEAEVRKLA